MLHGRPREVFHRADADLCLKDHCQQGIVVHGHDQQAEPLALMVDAVEIGLLDEAGDGLVGHVGAGGQGGDGGQVKLLRIPLAGDEEPGLINDQRRGGVALFDQLAQLAFEPRDVFLDELGQVGHVMRTADFPG